MIAGRAHVGDPRTMSDDDLEWAIANGYLACDWCGSRALAIDADVGLVCEACAGETRK